MTYIIYFLKKKGLGSNLVQEGKTLVGVDEEETPKMSDLHLLWRE